MHADTFITTSTFQPTNTQKHTMEVATCINVNGTTLFLFVLVFSLLRIGHAAAPAVYVLGASMVDVGNNNYLPLSVAKADFPHNGIDYPDRKSTGRFSNGMKLC